MSGEHSEGEALGSPHCFYFKKKKKERQKDKRNALELNTAVFETQLCLTPAV
jgi:hypothetical protein